MFLYQSSGLQITNNQIMTLNPVSINRIQEVNDSVISDNIYNSANPAAQESVRVLDCQGTKFIKNKIDKRSGGKKFTNTSKLLVQ